MRLDHIAYRVADRHKTADFFMTAFGYRLQTEFEINFDDNTKAKCLALEPPEKPLDSAPWTALVPNGIESAAVDNGHHGVEVVGPETNGRQRNIVQYHLPPEIFISDGDPTSIVGQWVAARGGVGGIHHLAYQVESVETTMREWRAKGYAEFSTDDVLRCTDLVQVFTKPSALTGVIYEFISRGKHGFCADNVKDLMHSTRAFK